MRAMLKYLFLAVAVLLFGWAFIQWTEWLPRITPAQQSALALMRAPPERAMGAHNAWELFWLLPFEVPEQDVRAVLDEDIRALDALADGPFKGEFSSVAEDRYPRRFPRPGGPHRICAGDAPCLTGVREDPAAAEAEWTASTSLLAAARQLGNYDHYRTPHRPSLQAPFPNLTQAQPVMLLDVALQFSRGDTQAALARHCADTLAWRQLKGHTDSLLFESVTAAHLRRATSLYADMRGELPAGVALPADCRAAFGLPRAEERQSCDVYRAEYRMLDAAMQPQMLAQGPGEPAGLDGMRRWFADIAINQKAMSARSAERFAALCAVLDTPSKQIRQAIRAGVHACGVAEKLFDPVGCILSDIASPAYTDYWKRDRDWEGSVRLVVLADALGQAADPSAAFAAAQSLRSGFEQEVRFADGRLGMRPLLVRSEPEGWWSIPLPGSAVDAEAATAVE
ncbi:MAG: hypothetical protein KDJ14_06525 [Xanthomonadales bacterium]|nr:hypothetical protein [Xanthomonadales bacterium]